MAMVTAMTSLDSMGDESRASDFIGRQRESAVLTAALDNALAGRGRLVMLAGEPGIGKTNREIGEELFISAKTVGGHVSNILNETNAANRTEAATYAALHGLVANP